MSKQKRIKSQEEDSAVTSMLLLAAGEEALPMKPFTWSITKEALKVSWAMGGVPQSKTAPLRKAVDSILVPSKDALNAYFPSRCSLLYNQLAKLLEEREEMLEKQFQKEWVMHWLLSKVKYANGNEPLGTHWITLVEMSKELLLAGGGGVYDYTDANLRKRIYECDEFTPTFLANWITKVDRETRVRTIVEPEEARKYNNRLAASFKAELEANGPVKVFVLRGNSTHNHSFGRIRAIDDTKPYHTATLDVMLTASGPPNASDVNWNATPSYTVDTRLYEEVIRERFSKTKPRLKFKVIKF
jgi:hypothetical protein